MSDGTTPYVPLPTERQKLRERRLTASGVGTTRDLDLATTGDFDMPIFWEGAIFRDVGRTRTPAGHSIGRLLE